LYKGEELIKWYTFYLFDNVPLIVKDSLGNDYSISPQFTMPYMYAYWPEETVYFNICNFPPSVFGFKVQTNDMCVLVAKWNTKRWNWQVLPGTFVKVMN